MTVRQLADLDFFDLKNLADQKGIFYVRNGEVFIYHGADKLKIDPHQPATCDPFNTKEETGLDPDTFQFGDATAKKLDPTKDTKGNGTFHFWQHDDYFILHFVTENNKHHKGTVYVLKAGKVSEHI